MKVSDEKVDAAIVKQRSERSSEQSGRGRT